MRKLVFLPMLLVACSSDDTVVNDAGPEGGAKDATTDTAKDVVTDVAKKDVATDVTNDTTLDAPKDAPLDVTADVGVDAPTDSSADASDGGSTYHTPTCDGTVSSSEYGGTSYVTTSGQQTWYVTWDATNLYVALDNATLTEANVV